MVPRSAQPPRLSSASALGPQWSLGIASSSPALCCSWYRSEDQRCAPIGQLSMPGSCDCIIGCSPPPQAKHLQFASGVHVSSYWMATFLWDLISCFVSVVLSVIIFAAFQATGYTGEGLAGVTMLLVSYDLFPPGWGYVHLDGNISTWVRIFAPG